jgi:predicted outer membrane repeat protein
VLNSVFIANQTVNTNASDFGGGGAISVSTGSSLTVENSQFIGNTASGFGGAIRFSDEAVGGSQLNLINNLFTANVADSVSGTPEGGAISVIDGGGVSMSNNTIVFNQADPGGLVAGSGGIGFFNSGQFNPPPTPPAIYVLNDNIIRDNADATPSGEDDNVKLASSIPPAALDRQSNNVGFNADAGDIDADPVFSNGFYLGAQSTNPSVNGGSIQATTAGLVDPFTTSTDGVGDTGALDIGFHYRKGNLKFGFAATASPGVGQCFGDVEQQFTINDFDGAPIGEGRTVVVDIASADPSLGNVTLVGVGTLAPVGLSSALLRPLSNGNYGLTIQTDVSTQVGNLILDVYIDDLASPRTSVFIDYADACN